jgi:hypothetical protein
VDSSDAGASSQNPRRCSKYASSSFANVGCSSWFARIGVKPIVTGAATFMASSALNFSTSGR